MPDLKIMKSFHACTLLRFVLRPLLIGQEEDFISGSKLYTLYYDKP